MNRIGKFVVAMIVLRAGLAFSAPEVAGAAISVENFKDGEIIRYTTPLITGTLGDSKAVTVTLANQSSKRATRQMNGLAYAGRFKVLADLVPGENVLLIRAGQASTTLKLVYKPQTNPLKIRPVYYTDNTGDTSYPSPLANDSQNVTGKVSTAMLLLQSFVAENMNQHGFGRRTFNLDLEADGQVKVFIVKGSQNPGEFDHAGPNIGRIGNAVAKQAHGDGAHYLVILGKGCGYTALATRKQATFGGSCIYSWPDSIRDAQANFLNATPIDKKKFHVDAAGKNVFWANTANNLGACLHETLHTFGLPHSMDRFCVMTTGGEFFGRFFTFYDPPSAKKSTPVYFNDNQVARLSNTSASQLSCSRYFAMDDRSYLSKKDAGMAIVYDPKKQLIKVTSEIGIGFVALDPPLARYGTSYCVAIDPGKPPPKEVVIPASEWARFRGKPFQIRVIDADDHSFTNRDPMKGGASLPDGE